MEGSHNFVAEGLVVHNSELVEHACGRTGVVPKVPDGAFNQWAQCKNNDRLISVQQGLDTRGALLFVGDGVGTGRDAITHVAFSLGDGFTIEARGKRWGVGTWAAKHRFDFAGLISGVDYKPGHGRLPAPLEDEEDSMKIIEVSDGPEGGNAFYVEAGKEPKKIDSIPLHTELVKLLGPPHVVNGAVWDLLTR